MWLIIHPVLKSSQESLTYIYWMAVQLAVHHIQWPRCGRGFCLWEVQHCPWPAGQPISGKGAGWRIFILPCGPSLWPGQLLDLKDSLWVPVTQRLHREGTSCQIFPAVVIEGKDQGVWPESEFNQACQWAEGSPLSCPGQCPCPLSSVRSEHQLDWHVFRGGGPFPPFRGPIAAGEGTKFNQSPGWSRRRDDIIALSLWSVKELTKDIERLIIFWVGKANSWRIWLRRSCARLRSTTTLSGIVKLKFESY